MSEQGDRPAHRWYCDQTDATVLERLIAGDTDTAAQFIASLSKRAKNLMVPLVDPADPATVANDTYTQIHFRIGAHPRHKPYDSRHGCFCALVQQILRTQIHEHWRESSPELRNALKQCHNWRIRLTDYLQRQGDAHRLLVMRTAYGSWTRAYLDRGDSIQGDNSLPEFLDELLASPDVTNEVKHAAEQLSRATHRLRSTTSRRDPLPTWEGVHVVPDVVTTLDAIQLLRWMRPRLPLEGQQLLDDYFAASEPSAREEALIRLADYVEDNHQSSWHLGIIKDWTGGT